ncbi:histidine phosphatase family protein [Pseudohongiella spirulinae]|uniref:Phosphoglycerate mutase n=1 Tax=Pseudohongiella spirulinae TaxID=1249552 RepID=A0A0S2KG93_9GAMM|nr:histidine phosphatase family protein [Pseudohongiella spirulinae]ALO47060.1 Phosphoglycerate mutase [Pseudohongiella spirulinae]
MRLIHLIRHGETNWNRERRAQGQQESILTDTGRQQALQLGQRMTDTPLEAVFVSSSQRTRQTAELAFADRNLEIEHCDLLREIHMGPWEGQLYVDIQSAEPEQFHAFWHAPEKFSLAGAETFEQIQQRALQRFRHILESSAADNIAIVSHGIWIKSLLCALEPRPLSKLWEPPAMHNCSLSTIAIHPDGNQRIVMYSDKPYSSEQVESTQ